MLTLQNRRMMRYDEYVMDVLAITIVVYGKNVQTT